MTRRSNETLDDLLQITRDTLSERVLPLLDQDGRYTVRMAVNAIRITQRAMRAGDASCGLETDLQAFYSSTDPALEAERKDARRRFAADIRAGRFDDTTSSQQIRRVLRDDVQRRLLVSNPKYLQKLLDGS